MPDLGREDNSSDANDCIEDLSHGEKERHRHTPGPWGLCYHLESPEQDAACPCGFRGGIWGPDEEHTVCEMGSTRVPGEEGLEPPRYPRATELANARLIAAAPDLLEAAKLALDNGYPLPAEAARKLRAAIAKAEVGGDANAEAIDSGMTHSGATGQRREPS